MTDVNHGEPVVMSTDDLDTAIDPNSDLLKLEGLLVGAVQALDRSDPTVPGLRMWLKNHLLPIMTRMVTADGATRAVAYQAAEAADQAAMLAQNQLAGETLSFLVPGIFALDQYVSATLPQKHPIRLGLAFLLQACEGVRELFGDNFEEVTAAMASFIATAADPTPPAEVATEAPGVTPP